jgi:hypothetical protein
MIRIVDASGGSLQSNGSLSVDSSGETAARESDGSSIHDCSDGFECQWLAHLLETGMTAADTGELNVCDDVHNEMGIASSGEQLTPAEYRAGEAAVVRRGKQLPVAEPYSTVSATGVSDDSGSLQSKVFAGNSVGRSRPEKDALEVPRSPESKVRRGFSVHTEIQVALQQQCALVDPSIVQPVVIAESEPVTSIAVHRPEEPERIEQQTGAVAQRREEELVNQAVAVLPNPQVDRENAIVAEATPKALEFQRIGDAKNSGKAKSEHLSSSHAVASAKSPELESGLGLDTEGPEASMLLRSRILSPSSVLQPSSAPSTLARHSHLRNSDDDVRDFDRHANGAGTAMAVVQNLSHSAAPGPAPDEAIRDSRERTLQSLSGLPAQSSRVLDIPLKHPEQQWIHTGAHFAEAGFQDASLGWISVRATRDPAGLHAVLVPPSAEAERTLSEHLGGLNTYLVNNQIAVGAVALSSYEDARHTASFGGDAQQRNAREGGDERGNKPRAGAVKRADGGVSSPGVSSHDDLNRYESPWARAGTIGQREMHISLVA